MTSCCHGGTVLTKIQGCLTGEKKISDMGIGARAYFLACIFCSNIYINEKSNVKGVETPNIGLGFSEWILIYDLENDQACCADRGIGISFIWSLIYLNRVKRWESCRDWMINVPAVSIKIYIIILALKNSVLVNVMLCSPARWEGEPTSVSADNFSCGLLPQTHGGTPRPEARECPPGCSYEC